MEGDPEGAKVMIPLGCGSIYICPILCLTVKLPRYRKYLKVYLLISFLTASEENKISLNIRISFLELL